MPTPTKHPQIRIYMNAKTSGSSQETAAAQAGIQRAPPNGLQRGRIARNGDACGTGRRGPTPSTGFGSGNCNRYWSRNHASNPIVQKESGFGTAMNFPFLRPSGAFPLPKPISAEQYFFGNAEAAVLAVKQR